MASKFLNLSTDTTLGGNNSSDTIASSQKAIKTYVDNKTTSDNETINLNTNQELQTIGVKTKSSDIMYDWVGTLAQYNAGIAGGTISSDWVCWITDEDEESLKGEGIPTGGTTGQVLTKRSGADYDSEWVTPSTTPSVDNNTTSLNQLNEIQAFGLLNQNSGISKIWTGTKAEYDTITTKDSGTIYNVTDEVSSTTLDNLASTDLSNLETSGIRYASGLSFPSTRYVALTLGASGTQYTAPANGWLTLGVVLNNGKIALNNRTRQPFVNSHFGTSVGGGEVIIPCCSGDIIMIEYSNLTTTNYFGFIYAEGDQQ